MHHLACLGREHGRQEVVAALQTALKNTAREWAGLVGHIICAEIGVGRTRGAQAHRKAATEIEQHLRNKIAGVAQSLPALGGSLFYKLVVCILKQVFKIDQVL